MVAVRKSESSWLLLGDVAVFIASLYFTLVLRNLTVPSVENFLAHFAPFSLLFVLWVLVFFIAGLYDKYTLLIKSKLPQKVLTAHLFNLSIATLFFYIVPFFSVAPKITLFLYLLVSAVFLSIWRFFLYPRISKQSAINILILASGPDVEYLKMRVDASEGQLMRIKNILKPEDLVVSSGETILSFIKSEIEEHEISVIAVDLLSPAVQKNLPALYSLIFEGMQFINIQDLYEHVTDKVPLGLINETWFLEHASIEPNFIYDAVKRIMDLVIAIPLFLCSLVFYPLVWVCMKLEGGGPLFYTPIRVGEANKKIKMYKFRTMTVMDTGNQLGKNADKVTRLGKVLRVTRIDELPQLWNIIKGELSLIGPRPEFPKLVDLYNIEIPHFNVRHLIKPGLSGWAQIHHEKPPHTVEETIEKLAYDLFYIKNRSVLLDFKIALQTIKTLLSRVGV
jgi:lipopolysaccharide/colanic/teichoic acid biosynthesis glycosyltransferase